MLSKQSLTHNLSKLIFVKCLNDDLEKCFTEEGVTHTIVRD